MRCVECCCSLADAVERIVSLPAVGVWRAALAQDWRKHVSAGEQAVVILLGADKRQAAILRKYCRGLLEAPRLRAEVVRDTDEVIEFRNGGSLEVTTNDARLVRGRSAIAVLGSGCCHWKTDEHSSSSDEEVVAAAEPSLSMCRDGAGLLLLGSSVYRKRGYMFRQFRKLHGNADAEDICWFAPSSVMNPKLPLSVIERALAEDRAKASAEYLGLWRDDVSDYIPVELPEAVTDWNVLERPYKSGVVYNAYVDAATGLGSSSFTLAIAHREADDTVVLDVLRERRPPFIPRDTVKEFADLVKSVHGDDFARGFHDTLWKDNGIRFEDKKFTTSDNYLHLLLKLLAKQVRFIDSATLRSQLASLERHVPASGFEIIRKPQIGSARDDCAAAVAGAMVIAGGKLAYLQDYSLWV